MNDRICASPANGWMIGVAADVGQHFPATFTLFTCGGFGNDPCITDVIKGKTVFRSHGSVFSVPDEIKEKQQDTQKGLQQGPRERNPRSVLWYVRTVSRPRTPLVAFFSILLTSVLVAPSTSSR